VKHRAGEIGLRATLGASPKKIRWSFLLEGLRLGLFGIVIGLPVGLVVLRIIASSPGSEIQRWTSIPAGVATALALLATALLASWLPARRAAAVDPMTVLRVE
jgi:ABC-type antimicrobial peptide transport system permease subunit